MLHTHAQVPYYQVQGFASESFRVLEMTGRTVGCSWHFHPEYQLSYVVRGRGQRVVGDSLCPIVSGEVTLLGPNLPHVWRYDEFSEECDQTHFVVIHFQEGFLGSEFFRKPEARDMRLLLARSGVGLQAQGETRQLAAEQMLALRNSVGFQRLLDFLSLLHLLAASAELTEICTAGFQPFSAELQVERLRRVCDFIHQHFAEHLSRDQVARVAHLSPSAFSRFFRAGTGKTFQEFVNEVRIGHACRLLLETGLSVTEVALRCGFADASAFDRSFRRVKQMSPRELRQRMEGVLESSLNTVNSPEPHRGDPRGGLSRAQTFPG